MSLSEVDICNLASSKIGNDNMITSIGEDTREGKQFELLYAQTRDALLQTHTWNFAIGRKSLSQDTETPDFEFSYQYHLPGDYLRAITLYNDSGPFRVESSDDGNRKVLKTDSISANLIYIRKVTDTAQFSPLFIELLATKMAYSLGMVIAGKNKITLDEVKAIFKEAKRADGKEGTGEVFSIMGPTDYKDNIF